MREAGGEERWGFLQVEGRTSHSQVCALSTFPGVSEGGRVKKEAAPQVSMTHSWTRGFAGAGLIR